MGLLGFTILIALILISIALFPFLKLASLGFLGIILSFLFYKFFVRKYSQYERGVILRLGRFNRIAGPGWSVVIPFFEKELSRIDIRVQEMNLVIPEAYTEKEIRLKVSGFIYYKVTNPRKAVLEVRDYKKALRNLITGTTRDLISSMSITEVFANVADLNRYIGKMTRRKLWSWGLKVPNIKLIRVSPPERVREAMQKQKISKENYQAKKLEAEARKRVIEALGEGAKELDDRAIRYLYLKALQKIGGKATEMIFPMRFLTGLKNMGKQISKEGGGMGLGALGGMTLAEAVDKVKENIKEKGKEAAAKSVQKAKKSKEA